MALLLVNNLVVAFDASKYRDGYRDKLDELIQAKLHARTVSAAEQRRPAPVVNILDALRRSLESDRGTPASLARRINSTGFMVGCSSFRAGLSTNHASPSSRRPHQK